MPTKKTAAESEVLSGDIITDTEVVTGEVVNDPTPEYNREDDPRFQTPPKTSWDYWTKIDVPELNNVELNNIKVCNGKLIAVGHNNTIAVYNREKAKFEAFQVPIDETIEINGINYCDDRYIIVCECGCIYTSTDLNTWTKIEVPVAHDQNLYSASTVGNGKFVVVGDNGLVLVSDDCVKFDLVTVPTNENLYDVIFADNAFVAVGRAGTIITSTDAVTWTKCDTNTTIDFESICYAEDKKLYVAMGAMNNVMRSTDLATWTAGPFGINNPLFGIAYGNNKFVGVGEAVITASDDGEAWGFLPYCNMETPIAVEFDGNTCWVVGTNGLILNCVSDAPVPEEVVEEV